ncbi:hypothetical protein VTL71DRAFT_9656 [Oculimacula yallundae]|uniref:Uncharacterized protein n=1 Tax=Oculimacula yallundae TaxID=86028 RepID=A0ABR4BST7_9HELO
MASPTQSAIIWPQEFLPGTTANFVTNEVIASNLSSSQIWALLSNISKWTSYYNNVSSITPPESGPSLKKGDKFHFSTFGFPVLACTVKESAAPEGGKAGRIAWSAKLDDGENSVSVYHAWLVEDLEGGRVRILTQESQDGKPVEDLAQKKPNKMLLGHQDWCEGLVRAARGEKTGETNLKAAGLGSYGNDL